MKTFKNIIYIIFKISLYAVWFYLLTIKKTELEHLIFIFAVLIYAVLDEKIDRLK